MGQIRVSVDLGAVPASLVAQAKGRPRLVHGMMDAAVNAAGPYLQRHLALATPRGATGGLAQHVYFERSQIGGKPQGFVGYAVPAGLYAPFVEEDTRPHWPPRAAMEYWVQRVLRVPNVRQVAYLISRKISRVGTKGKHMVADTASQQRSATQNLMANAAVRHVQQFVRTGRTSAA